MILLLFIRVIIFIKQPIIMKVILERTFIAIKKYGDAYVKLKALGYISSNNYRYPSNVWIIDSHERNELINKNVSIQKL